VEEERMRSIKTLLVAVALVVVAGTAAIAKAPEPEEFVTSLYHRFAFREPTAPEVSYWAERILRMTPEGAEKRLRNWFFVHAAYKTTLDRTVTTQEVEHLVDLLDRGEITFEAIQWTLFSSEEYKRAKAEGRAGKNFMKFTPAARPL
jgi:hypothetical protein